MEIRNSKRILVIGSCGAGKSTLSKKLQQTLDLPLIHLDQHYHKPNWEEPKKEEWNKIVAELAEQPSWIMDGNYASSFDIRFPFADTIIYLDYSTFSCLWRVIKRIFKYYGRARPDMAKGCKERFDLEFLNYVLTFNAKNRVNIYTKLEQVKNSKNVIVLKNDKEVDLFFLFINRNSRTSFPKH